MHADSQVYRETEVLLSYTLIYKQTHREQSETSALMDKHAVEKSCTVLLQRKVQINL